MTPPTRPPDLRGAACRNVEDKDIFFPFPGNYAAVDAAKAICRGCPVLAACRPWALAVARDMYANRQDMQGVWAGMSERDRQPYLTVRAECGTDAGFWLHVRLGERTCPACRAVHRYVREHGPAATAARNERRRGHRAACNAAAVVDVSAVAS
jgi:WhiB family redox-sensing transcriptional regulator